MTLTRSKTQTKKAQKSTPFVKKETVIEAPFVNKEMPKEPIKVVLNTYCKTNLTYKKIRQFILMLKSCKKIAIVVEQLKLEGYDENDIIFFKKIVNYGPYVYYDSFELDLSLFDDVFNF
jgi:hypothetical protein